MRPQPLIAVKDVEASSMWCTSDSLAARAQHGGPEYERLVANGVLVLQLHRWDVEHDHGPIGDPDAKPYGNGVLLWFEVDDFHAAVARAEELKADVVLPTHRNPPSGGGVAPNHWECWLRDPEGYYRRAREPGWLGGVSGRPATTSRSRRDLVHRGAPPSDDPLAGMPSCPAATSRI